MTYANGNQFVGFFEKGLPSGQGIFTYADGSTFEGEFENGLMEGEGFFVQNGTRFKVLYRQGRMQESELADNEQGSCKFPMNETSSQASVVCSFSDGSSYQGPMVDDSYEGKGTFLFANGTQYVGDFKSGEFHGQGSLTYADGTSSVSYTHLTLPTIYSV